MFYIFIITFLKKKKKRIVPNRTLSLCDSFEESKIQYIRTVSTAVVFHPLCIIRVGTNALVILVTVAQ